MSGNDFLKLYWTQYLMLEKETKACTKYVAFDSVNLKTFSNTFVKILLQIGSEVDIVAKELCKIIDPSQKVSNINQYYVIISGKYAEFQDIIISCGDMTLRPWYGWTSTNSPTWWKVYNAIKHDRYSIRTIFGVKQEIYKFANLENVLNGLSGLFQIEQYLFLLAQHDQHMSMPMPGSRLFQMTNHGWENKNQVGDDYFYVDNETGNLFWERADVSYNDI